MIVTHMRTIVVCMALLAGTVAMNAAQRGRGGAPPAVFRAGTIERAAVGSSEVTVYLPPNYASDMARRFPVVYLLGEPPIDALKLPEAADRLAVAQGFSEPIVVLVETASATGAQEKFVAEELVAYVDGHYRTIAARISRGLAGYSAGGDRALRIATTRASVFSSLRLMNASISDATLTMLDGAADDLRRYYAVAVDIGTKDTFIASNRRLHDAMTRLRIPHYYEEYDGDHTDKVSERVATRLLPFFSKNLAAPANPTSPAVQ
jgi:enterochelin esterase-like enzyme